MPDEVVEKALAMGSLHQKMVSMAGNFEEQLKMLKREFAFGIFEEQRGSATASSRAKLAALVELLQDRGGDPEELRSKVLLGTPLSPAVGASQSVGPEPPGVRPVPKRLPERRGLGAAFEQAAREGEQWVARSEGSLRSAPRSDPTYFLGSPGARAMEAGDLERVFMRQSELLEQALALKQQPRSTITVEPRITWPDLGGGGTGGK